MTEVDRDRLAAAQAGLLAALLAGAPAPDGFDPDRIRVQRNALIAKRRDLVARRRGFDPQTPTRWAFETQNPPT